MTSTETTRSVSTLSPTVESTADKQNASESDKKTWAAQFTGGSGANFPALPSAEYVPRSDAFLKFRTSVLVRDCNLPGLRYSVHLAWAILISHHTDSSDIVMGTWVKEKRFAPLCVRLDPEDSLKAATYALKRQIEAMMPFPEDSLETTQVDSPEAAIARHFQTQLIVDTEMPPNKGSPCKHDIKSPNRSLTLSCNVAPDNVVIIHAAYDSAVLDAVEIQRILQQFDHVYQQVCQSPCRLVKDSTVISPQDLLTLEEWNRTIPTPVDVCIHDLVLGHCDYQPDASAISSWDGDLTYEELRIYSSRLTQHLIRAGVQVGEIVPVCLAKSRWSLVALMAVFRAGAACALIDPSLPRARVEQMVQQTGHRTVLVAPSNRVLVEDLGDTVIEISSVIQDLRDIPDLEAPAVSPEALAVVVFTSGTTGVPKGVMLEHRTISSAVMNCNRAVDATVTSRGLFFASYAFDMSIYEPFAMLCCGGCVCIPSDEDRLNNLAGFLRRQRINWACLTASTARLIRPDEVPCLRTLLVTGEAVGQAIADQWAERVSLFNLYGPAEGTLAAIGKIVPRSWKPGTFGRMAVGRGWVVEPLDLSRLAALGAVGELLLEGPNVARGYVNDPIRTGEAFVAPPAWRQRFAICTSSPTPTQMYRTGDLVKYNSDGSLMYIGRKDGQVKLHGQRIELGEVEQHTGMSFQRTGHDAISVVAEVVSIQSRATAATLIAFVVVPDVSSTGVDCILAAPSDDFHRVAAQVQADLRTTIPSYMVPAVVLPLVQLPLTPSGKTDRRRLREMAAALSPAELDAYLHPMARDQRPVSTPMEQTVRSILATALTLPEHEIHAGHSFFALGGNSIGAMHASADARSRGVAMTVADIFSHPVLADLASHITYAASSEPSLEWAEGPAFSLVKDLGDLDVFQSSLRRQGVIPAKGVAVDVLPMTRSQTDMMQSCSTGYFLFLYQHRICPRRLRAACQAVIQRHSILRTVFTASRVGLVQVVLDQVDVSFEEIEASEDLGMFPHRLREVVSNTPSLQDPGPAMPQFTLFSNPSGAPVKHAFVMRGSHTQYDGVSIFRLWEDLSSAYRGQELRPCLTFAQYVYQRSRHERAKAYAFWQDYLAGSSVTRLTESCPPVRADAGPPRDMIVEASSGDIEPHPQPPVGITLASLVKAAWAFTLAEHTGTLDVVFGQKSHGRSLPLPGVDEIMGPCMIDLPFRVMLEPGWTVLDLLRHAQSQHLRTMHYDYLDLGEVVSGSTAWPPETNMDSFVFHQNMERGMSLGLDTDDDDPYGASPVMAVLEDFSPEGAMWLNSHPHERGLHLELRFRSDNKFVHVAEALVERLSQVVRVFSACPEQHLSYLTSRLDLG